MSRASRKNGASSNRWPPVAIAVTLLLATVIADPADAVLKVSQLAVVGDAEQLQDRLRLTTTETFQAGAAWTQEPQTVRRGFAATFEFELACGAACADGLAFVIQNDDPSALGDSGGYLGYDGIANSVAVEIDTYLNEDFGDPSETHVGVHTRGTNPNSALESASIGSASIDAVSDGSVHTARVWYTPRTLDVYIDDLDTPVLSVGLNLGGRLDLAPGGRAYVGFTAATGAGGQSHDVLSFSFAESIVSRPGDPLRREGQSGRAVRATNPGPWPLLPAAPYIWWTPDGDEGSKLRFSKSFRIPAGATGLVGTIQITADNAYKVVLNGELVGQDGVLRIDGNDDCIPSCAWETIETYSLSLAVGRNRLRIRAVNNIFEAGVNPAGLTYRLDYAYVS